MNTPLRPEDPSASNRPLGVGRPMTILGAIAVGIGLVGFLVGIAEPVIPQRAVALVGAAPTEASIVAPSYRDITSANVGPNRSWNSNLASLKQPRPDLFAAVTRTAAMKDAALRDRLRTRAFDGAPPVIPHLVEQRSAQSCLVCHGEGLLLGNRIATKISHPHYANCLGCHVEQAGGLPLVTQVAPVVKTSEEPAPSPIPGNVFAGRLRAGPGTRAMPGAPPTIPHTLHLRGDCMSCHGLIARPGLRTTHPWLQNCIQCHVSPDEIERIPFRSAPTAATPRAETFLSTTPAQAVQRRHP